MLQLGKLTNVILQDIVQHYKSCTLKIAYVEDLTFSIICTSTLNKARFFLTCRLYVIMIIVPLNRKFALQYTDIYDHVYICHMLPYFNATRWVNYLLKIQYNYRASTYVLAILSLVLKYITNIFKLLKNLDSFLFIFYIIIFY